MNRFDDKSGYSKLEPVVSLITPPGEGGIGVILLQDHGAGPLLESFFRGVSRGVTDMDIGQLAYGHFTREGTALDEVIVARTGEEKFEINCHGGVAAVRAVRDCLVDHGAEPRPWSELARQDEDSEHPLSARAIRASAMAKLPRAETRLGVRVLLHQINGSLVRGLGEVLDCRTSRDIRTSLREIQKYSPLGKALVSSPSVLLAGPPNVGKSTLLNALLERERVIVHDQPGTTRDIVRETVSIQGVPIELLDSAGMRQDSEELEKVAIRKAQRLLHECDVLVLVYDCRQHLSEALRTLPGLPDNKRILLAANKMDLLTTDPADPDIPGHLDGVPHIFISAEEGTGLEDLEDALIAPFQDLIAGAASGAPVPFDTTTAGAVDAVLQVASIDADEALQQLERLMGSPGHGAG